MKRLRRAKGQLRLHHQSLPQIKRARRRLSNAPATTLCPIEWAAAQRAPLVRTAVGAVVVVLLVETREVELEVVYWVVVA